MHPEHSLFSTRQLLRALLYQTLTRKWQPTPVFLSGKSHGQRSLVSYSPCSSKESDMTERLHFQILLWGFLVQLIWEEGN